MKKRILVLLFLVLLGVNLTGCAPKQSPEAQPKRVVYLINGALGDNAFYDSGKAGIDAIAKQYGVETRTIECNFDAGKYEPSLQAAV
ncbi:MAG: BMP family ABC transporter substrate-binding protein, partial [Anaerolineaceae bacterium]|nr:BMP family ABC transporter substrate-binding protein [Anaerolineaceae bacterium]